MSGPKCMDVVPTTLARARTGNAAECKHTLAGYRSLFDRFEKLHAQIGGLGLKSPGKPATPEKLKQMVEATFAVRSCDGIETVHHLYREKGRLESLIQKAEKQVQHRVMELQGRFQALAQNSARLRHQVDHLDAYVEATLPADWPAPEREAVLQRMRTAQKDGEPPPSVEADLSLAGIARLESAEQAIAKASRKLEQWQESLTAEVQVAHEAKVRAAQTADTQRKEAAAAAVRHREAERRENLHRELAVASPRVSLADFLPPPPAPSAKEGKVLGKLDDLMAKVGALQDTAGWADLMRRAVAVRAEIDPHRRLQLFESLSLEAGARLKALRAAATWQDEVDTLLHEAADYIGTSVAAVASELRELRRAGRVVPLEPLKQRLAQTKQRELARLQREDQRRAILESLTALGYEVTEGMGTALVEAGKIVIHKPGESAYAIELVANADLSVVQTSMVRYADSDTLTEQQRLRDHERETEWCGDHKRIRDQLEQRGYQTSFKMQMPAGTHPVRLVQRGAAPAARPTARGKMQSN